MNNKHEWTLSDEITGDALQLDTQISCGIWIRQECLARGIRLYRLNQAVSKKLNENTSPAQFSQMLSGAYNMPKAERVLKTAHQILTEGQTV